MQTKLRIGLAEQTLLAALGHAVVYAEKQSLSSANMGSRLEEVIELLWIGSFFMYLQFFTVSIVV